MYAISNARGVYISFFLCLCAAFLLAPSVANANVPTTLRPDIQDMVREVQRELNNNVNRPSGSVLSTSSAAPTITKNPAGGLSATTNNILKTLDQPSSFSATSNYSVASAKNALKSCVRSPACAGRALGAGAVIYEGIKGWQTVYEILYDQNTNQYTRLDRENPTIIAPNLPNPARTATAHAFDISIDDSCPSKYQGYTILKCVPHTDTHKRAIGCSPRQGEYNLAGFNGTNECQYARVPPLQEVYPEVPVTSLQLDDYIDQGYDPHPSDAPVVITGGGSPESITLSTPASADLPATTTTNTDSQGKTTTTVKNAVITYNILNNSSSSPSIESTITETSNTYDDTANLVGSMTSTTTNNAVQPDPLPPSSGASADIELPPFCTYASIVCDWIGWTKEGIEGEEPDLINLISEFEPDENQYNSGIGSGSCPAPMSLNLGIINRVVEVSYQPFCDFLDMIRPLVIAGAWLLSAFMYVGVLRRG